MTLQRSSGLICTESGSETILVNLSNGRFFGLGPTGALIWKELEQPRTTESVLGLLLESFDVLPEVARADLDSFFASLTKEGLAFPVSSPVEHPNGEFPAQRGSALYHPPRLDRGAFRHAAKTR